MTRGLLLDTHVVLWALAEPDRLSETARITLADPRVDLWVSAVSAFEIATKHRLGKLPGAERILAELNPLLTRLGAQQLPITMSHASIAGSLEWDHRDPFDRLLAAQAQLESLPLMTADVVFGQLPSVRVSPA